MNANPYKQQVITMKLLNSVLPLKAMLDETIFNRDGIQAILKANFRHCEANPRIKKPLTALRYNIWCSLSKKQRDEVIAHSNLPCVGGYYAYTDANLDALLNRALPLTTLERIVA